MNKDRKKRVKKDIKWLKYAIKNFDKGAIAMVQTDYGEFSTLEIAARYLMGKGKPFGLGYGTSKAFRNCYISIV